MSGNGANAAPGVRGLDRLLRATGLSASGEEEWQSPTLSNMKNVHAREMRAPMEQLRPWIEAAWSGCPRDPFPRDILKSWRKNPPDADPHALIPDVTRVGHGFFSFRFQSWDGERWRVRFESDAARGWHGFDLQTSPLGSRVTHTIEATQSVRGALFWHVFVAPIHDCSSRPCSTASRRLSRPGRCRP
jgi:hypothetical protein